MIPIYLDNQATTPLAPEVFDAMLPWLKDNFGNPHSPHVMGRQAAAAVEVAREQVAALLPQNGRVIFTGSATEAINLAFGAARTRHGRDQIAVIDTEHAAVRDTALWYRTQGFETTLLPVDAHGLIVLEALEACLGEKTALVGAMLVNNEIGTIQPVEQIAAMAHEAGALMLCDAVQGFGRIDLPQQADLIALSGHKIYGPKGIGALWVRDGIDLPPLIHGGGQEQGVRSGTLSPALCAGLGAAAKLCADRRQADMDHIVDLAERARSLFGDWSINGSTERRYAGNLNIRRDGLDVARLMSDVRGVAFSAGSACASGSGRPSHVLAALGLKPAQIKSSIRLGFGRYNDIDDVEQAAHLINQAAEKQLS
ncbi:MAG: cysteine desulfurase [Sphingomonadales bacterium]|nr:cysteine desulfurase [Sphingomonadales bacterium]